VTGSGHAGVTTGSMHGQHASSVDKRVPKGKAVARVPSCGMMKTA
jgi:hypothetical protein